jgi:dihydroorotate dehydrogenase (NAD+) catalytic subunit
MFFPPQIGAERSAGRELHVLRTRLFHWDLANPVLIGSGPLTSCSRTMRKMLRAGAGGLVTKSIVPRADTRHCRCSRYGDVLFNRDGYSQRDIEAWEEDLGQHRGEPIIANIVADSPDELAALAVRVTRAGAEVIELGLSCPTLEEDPACCDPEKLRAFCSRVRSAVDVPLIVKLLLSTSASANREMARVARSTGMDALTIADTVPALLLDQHTAAPLLGGAGGASGAFLKPLVLKAISDIRQMGLEIIGCGGILNATDALDYLHLGCSAVQVCTFVMNQSFRAIQSLVNDLEAQLRLRGTTVGELRTQGRVQGGRAVI